MKCILSVCVLFITGSLALPQYNYAQQQQQQQQQSDSQGYGQNTGAVPCTPSTRADGKLVFNCNGPAPSIRAEHILWLNAPVLKTKDLDINVPNYKLEEVIIGAVKEYRDKLQSNINVKLSRPEQSYVVQKQGDDQLYEIKQNVGLSYEPAPGPIKLHYPTDKQYDPLSYKVDEP